MASQFHPCVPQSQDVERPPAPPDCRPIASAWAAPRSSSDRFEQLLRDVSAEYQLLQRQIASLAGESSDLHAASGETSQEIKPLSTWSPKSGAVKKTVKVCGTDGEPLARLSTASLGAVPEGKQVTLPSAVSFCSSFRSTKHSWISVGTDTGATPQQLFKRLDPEGAGRLSVGELAHIMQNAGEFVDNKTLIELVRILANLESEDARSWGSTNSTQDEMKSGQAASIDFNAFERLMEGSVSHAHLSSDLATCITSLQRACKSVAAEQGLVKLRPRPSSSKRGQQDCPYSFWLETVPTVVIVVNTIVAGLTADHPDQQKLWDICEVVFAAFYAFEVVVKIGIHGCISYWCGPQRMWNCFDFACLLVSLSDIFGKVAVALMADQASQPNLRTLMMVKIFRLARLARLVRALRFKFFHELKLMVMGVVSGLRVLFWAIVLLILLTYLVGISFTNLMGEQEPEFSSVSSSMFTLFRCWTEGCAAYDGTPLAERLRRHHGPVFMVAHVLITTFVIVGVFNLIMAIFIDNVTTSQNMRKHQEMNERTGEVEMKVKRMLISFIKDKDDETTDTNNKPTLFQKATGKVSAWSGRRTHHRGRAQRMVNNDWDRLAHENTSITREVFNSWLEDEDFRSLLGEAEIEMTNCFELFDSLDGDMSGELSLGELKTGLMKLRGPVTKADIVAVRLNVENLTRIFETSLHLSEGHNGAGYEPRLVSLCSSKCSISKNW